MSTDPLEQLKQRYRRSLPDKQQRLEQLRDRLVAGEPCHDEIKALCHKLVGSGASYGWLAISDAAALVESAEPEAMEPPLTGLIAVFADACAEA